MAEGTDFDYLDRIADEWRSRAQELAAWAMAHLVNRTDVWGRYLAPRAGESSARVITAPFTNERGKAYLSEASLIKHFQAKKPTGILGVHSTSADFTSRCLAIDIDRHDESDVSVTPEGNLSAAIAWLQKLQGFGCDPLLLDSNGIGGLHILVVFAEPMATESVHRFGVELVQDHEQRGLSEQPEIFPGSPRRDQHYGNWLRLSGRHHSRPHYSRVWNDDPWTDEQWLAVREFRR